MPKTKAVPLILLILLPLACLAPQRLVNPLNAPAETAPESTRLPAPTDAPTAAPTPSLTPTQPAPPPNILFLLTDDQDADSLAFMPNVQALLVQRGVQLQNYLVNVSLCCPSRTSTLLGRYAHNTQVLTNGGDNGGYHRFFELGYEEQTIALALQQAGYRTALFGKYLNGYPDRTDPGHIPAGWSEWYSPADGDPYSEYGYTLNENGKPVPYGSQPEDYLTDVLSQKAQDFIQRSAADGRPFFAYIAVYAPHGPYTPAPRHAGLFANEPLPKPPSFNEADVSQKPQFVQQQVMITPRAKARLEEIYHLRLQALQSVDEMTAALVQKLEAAGQLENTYIFYTSDNGYHLGQHRLRTGKQTAYEEDIRMPFVARGPGLPAGVQRRALAGNIDLAPTFAALAGLDYPNCDGQIG